MQLECQNAHSKRGGSSQGYSSDESDQNPFGRHERGRAKRFTRDFDTIKIDLPEFHGRLISEEFLEWLSVIEKFFYYKDIHEHQQVKLVATRLRDYTSTWWDKVQEMRLCKGKPKISSWEKMKTRLQEQFLPPYFTQYSFSQFNLRQETKSVVKYTEEFYKLSACNDIQETEEQLTTNHGAAAVSQRNNTNNSSSCFKGGQTGHQDKSCPKQQVDT